uniref:Uncharacterized protein n=1 Tax=viral metagenome TaxID=1070528 RepID=A0A6H1ZI02_9ZZZZ
MTDEQKERLKKLLEEMCDCFIHEIIATAKERVKVAEAYDDLIDLIDRVPTEEEAKEAWDVLQRGLSRCESVNEKACARCSKFKGCQEGEETIRKALGGEEFDE